MTKYGLPVATVCRTDNASRTPVFQWRPFLGERRCNGLQVGGVGPVISLYPLPVMIGDQSRIGVFFVFFFKCHSISKRRASHDQSVTTEQIATLTFRSQVENTVSALNGFLSFVWHLVPVFLSCWNPGELLSYVHSGLVIFKCEWTSI